MRSVQESCSRSQHTFENLGLNPTQQHRQSVFDLRSLLDETPALRALSTGKPLTHSYDISQVAAAREGLDKSADLSQVPAVHDVLEVDRVRTPAVAAVVDVAVGCIGQIADNIERRYTVLQTSV
jgi:hypothetical protein